MRAKRHTATALFPQANQTRRVHPLATPCMHALRRSGTKEDDTVQRTRAVTGTSDDGVLQRDAVEFKTRTSSVRQARSTGIGFQTRHKGQYTLIANAATTLRGVLPRLHPARAPPATPSLPLHVSAPAKAQHAAMTEFVARTVYARTRAHPLSGAGTGAFFRQRQRWRHKPQRS